MKLNDANPSFLDFTIVSGLLCGVLFFVLFPGIEETRREARIAYAYRTVCEIAESLSADASSTSTRSEIDTDPWGQPYRVFKSIKGMQVVSSGPNQTSPPTGIDHDDIHSEMPSSPIESIHAAKRRKLLLALSMPVIWLTGLIAYFRFSQRKSPNVDAGDSGDNSGTDSDEVAMTPQSSVLVKIVNLFGALAAVGSVLSFFAAFHWIPDILSQLTVQFLALLIPVSILAWSRRKKWLGVFLVLLMGGHFFKIMPYYLPPADGIENRAEVASYRLAVFNVLRTNEQFEQTLESILATGADVIYLMEVQPAWKPYLSSVKDQYPYQKVLADPSYTGVALLSKYPWRQLEVVNLGAVSNPSIDAYIQLDQNSDSEVHLIATHPLPPLGHALTRERDAQMKTLVDRFNDAEANLLCGDFNLSPWSPRFNAICERGPLVDGSIGFGLTPTLIPLPTLLGGVKVDHVLRNHAIRVHGYQVQKTKTSDHGIVAFDFSVRQ